MVNVEDFDSSLLKIGKNRRKIVISDIYFIGYITTKTLSNYKSINSVNHLYFIVIEVKGYIEEKNKQIFNFCFYR